MTARSSPAGSHTALDATTGLRFLKTCQSSDYYKIVEATAIVGSRSIAGPMRQLLQIQAEFAWITPQQESFQKVKDILTQTPGPVLAYYDPSKELILQVDASKYGLGATLIQEGRPLAYASKALTHTEVNYAQI